MDGEEALAVIQGTPSNPLKGGRPSRAEIRALQRAKARIEKQISKASKKVADTYVQLAGGRWVNHYNAQTGVLIYKEFEADSAVTRHFIDRFVPPARPELGPGEALLLAGAGMILADYLRNRGQGPQDIGSDGVSEIIETTAVK